MDFFKQFLLLFTVILCIQCDLVLSLDVKCDQTLPSYCFIRNSINLAEGDQLNLLSPEHVQVVTDFEVTAGSNLRAIPQSIFAVLPALQGVHLNSVGIKYISQDSFQGATNVNNLLLASNNLSSIPSSAFSQANNLEHLDLSRNQIVQLEDNAFEGLPKLRTLKLGENHIKVITSLTFSGAENLEVIHLYSNDIETIEEGALKLPQLGEIFFDKNKLKTLPDDLFLNAQNVGITGFSDNQLTHVGHAFQHCQALSSLFLNNNQIKDLNLIDIAQLPSLKALSLENSGFNVPAEIPNVDTTIKSSLINLNLAKNNLTNPDILQHLSVFSELQKLYLEHNNFCHFNNVNNIKNIFPKLDTLDLTGNNLIHNWLKENAEIFKSNQINILF